jgi:hypothetical protein
MPLSGVAAGGGGGGGGGGGAYTSRGGGRDTRRMLVTLSSTLYTGSCHFDTSLLVEVVRHSIHHMV